MMLGLITAPAVRVPADFKKVLLLVFIVVNNQNLFYLFWNILYPSNQSRIELQEHSSFCYNASVTRQVIHIPRNDENPGFHTARMCDGCQAMSLVRCRLNLTGEQHR